jgi:branched-chain amino acid transport system ATP-binding protein
VSHARRSAWAAPAKAVVTPTHSSLLAEYDPPDTRVKVFSAHRLASSVGQILGPILAGGIAMALGWRTPFLILAVPTAVLVIVADSLEPPTHRGARRGLGSRTRPGGPVSTRYFVVRLR